MKLKYLFIILAVLIVGIGALLLFEIPHHNHRMMFLAESIVVFILLFLVYFYHKAIKPYNTISNGMELLREQDFGSKLRPVGQVEADAIVKIFNRMMEQLKNERLQVLEQNRLLDLLVKASPLGVIIFDFDGNISQCNDAARKMLATEATDDFTGKKLEAIGSPLAGALVNVKRGETRSLRLGDSQTYRCSHLTFFDHGFEHPFMLIESLTSEVMFAEKKAYEKVIRIIAHEVNNTTAGITSSLDSMRSVLQDSEGTEDLRDVMGVCIERCLAMSKFITNFADVVKIPDPALVPANLNDKVRACRPFLENLCNGKDIDLQYELTDSPLIVDIDFVLFEQVLINIVKNAAESIDKKGIIRITTSLSPAAIEIADDGMSISKDVEEKLFTPFFSTKPNGQGIGLIFIREVLLRHHCTFSLRTYSDGMTRFKILFPQH
jgi:nitrogen fixation/metabolism regulation signal transduction histidine kinase